MHKFLSALLLLALLCACVPAAPPQPTPLLTEIDPEEYALFSALIEGSAIGAKAGEAIVIREQTDPDLQNLDMALKAPQQPPEELVEAYRLRNAQVYTLSRSFSLQQTYELLPQATYDDLIHRRLAWTDFQAQHPLANGVYFFSRAGLNAGRDMALVSFSFYCGSLCGQGGVFWLVKENGDWKVKEQLLTWMS
ncbi:MAG: hypothetical protein AB1894_03820 [Chloroflexota bacterium]